MTDLPSGTVSLLFSDIEGSTVLLSRLGTAYAQALDGQRHVLREAWAAHGGTELGTEGDSFFVVFPTAEGAVRAATQAQRGLDVFRWPGGERVKVRMGVHTGTPAMHDGGYVGLDVHRAARIASAAHGGQVVLSEATSTLVPGCLPDGVRLKDLGSHQLKDIATPEHLFQLVIEGLVSEFPAIKTLGAASSLPRPPTPLVGRDGELAELTALLSSPEVRLVTMTGPGGSGKTRLAVGVANRLVDRFPDGLYFVPLAAAVTAEVMWTSIAEVLDVPPEGRIPPGFFDHVAHRTALFVLDNLEQIDGADGVVDQLLEVAPQVVLMATSRRPLHVAAEHEHPVPPLELPEKPSLEEAENSGAVQMFVQHARKVRPSFAMTADNAADVTEVCRRLDGLPLAIELAAARSKLLSPSALLSRLDKALDLAATGTRAPSRQRTLRDTIAWSYDLLSSQQQAIFRRLGVFAGGADFDAVTAVSSSIIGDADPLDEIAELVDANLVTIGEDSDGEPRVGMLETVRVYAVDQLRLAGELEVTKDAHAQHYLAITEALGASRRGSDHLGVKQQMEAELDNVREALTWTLKTNVESSERAACGQQLCKAVSWAWIRGGYVVEGIGWLELAARHSVRVDQTSAGNLSNLAYLMCLRGDLERSCQIAAEAVEQARALEDEVLLAGTLTDLANAQMALGNKNAGRKALEEALVLSRRNDDAGQLRSALYVLLAFEVGESRFDEALRHADEMISLGHAHRDALSVTMDRHNKSWVLTCMGRAQDAVAMLDSMVQDAIALDYPEFTFSFAETYAAALAELGEGSGAARLIGSAAAMRERLGMPLSPQHESSHADIQSLCLDVLSPQDWERLYQDGYSETVETVMVDISLERDARVSHG